MKTYAQLWAILASFAIGLSCQGATAHVRISEAGGSEHATALEAMTLVAQDLLALKASFRELSELTIELPLKRSLISYRYKTVYVPAKPASELTIELPLKRPRISYRFEIVDVPAQPADQSCWRVETGGCLLDIQCFPAGEVGWPAVPTGPSVSNAIWRLLHGGRLMASVNAPNQLLRKEIMAILTKRFASHRLQGTADHRP